MIVTRSTTAARSATTIHSEDTIVPDRPTTTIAIGSRTYEARAPKYQVWWDVLRQLESNDLAGAAAQRLADEGDSLSLAEQRELIEQINLAPAFGGMEAAIIHGEPTEIPGRYKGGFLRRCVSAEDWEHIQDELNDDASDLDLPDLYYAAKQLQEQFQSWFEARSETMGMVPPKTQNRQARRTTAKTAKPARKK